MSKKNLANAILGAALSDTATSATLGAGYGSVMPTVPFKLTLTPFGQLSTPGNSEIILVTARSSDTLTIVRAQNGTTAKSFALGDVVSNGVYIENSTAVGDIFMSMRATPAVGRLFMDGTTYLKVDYPLLYQLVVDNPAYGVTGGSTGTENFTLADFRERMPFGKSGNSPFTTLGATGGAKTHTLTEPQLPNISGSFTLHGQEGGTMFYTRAGYTTGGSYGGYKAPPGTTGGASSVTQPGFAFGQNQSHPIMNPYIVVNYEVIAG